MTAFIVVLALAAAFLAYAFVRGFRRSRRVLRTGVSVSGKRVMQITDKPTGPSGRPTGPRRTQEACLVRVRLDDEEHEVAVDAMTYDRIEVGGSVLLVYRLAWRGPKIEPLDIIPGFDA